MTYRVLPPPYAPQRGGADLPRLSRPQRLGLALLLAAIALAARAVLARYIPGTYHPIYLAAVALSAWFGGLLSGLVTALAISTAALELPGFPDNVSHWSMSLLSGVALAWLVASLLGGRRRAERSAARASRVHALNLALGPGLSPVEIARSVVGHAVEALQAGGGVLVLSDGGAPTLLHAEGVVPAGTVGPLLQEVIQDGTPRFLGRLPDGPGSAAVLPLFAAGRAVGALELRFPYRRRFGQEDRDFMLTLARQGAQALERSRLYQAERGARRHAENAGERLAFLAQASEVLASSLDYKATLAAVVRLAVPRLADWCAADVVDAEGRVHRLAISHAEPAKVEEVWEMSRRYSALPDDPVPRAIATGEPQLLTRITDEVLRAFARDPEHLERLRALDLRSLLIVPLRARERTLGALTFVMAESGREYTWADLPLAQDLARRAAMAVDNARLYQDAESALGSLNQMVALLDTVFTGAPVGLAFADRDLRFVRVNDALARLTGRSAGDFPGRTPTEVLGAEGDGLEEPFRRVLANGEPALDRELRAGGSGGGRRELLASFYPVRGREGRVEWVGIVALDLTERRHADELLMQSQRMEAIAKVAGGVAHEVNNMMTVINGFSGFLLESLPPGDARITDVAEIRKAADRAAGVTRQLLAYSRQQVLRPQPLELSRLVQSYAAVIERIVGSGITVRYRLADGVPPVRADPAQLEEVLVNLALNARDAMPDGGELTIETAAVALEGQAVGPGRPAIPPGRYARITVSDTGRGMDAETRARAFEPFFTTKRPGEGTGLGLAMVYGIVKQSGGFVWCYSEPGQGTAFKIYLPEHPGPAEPPEPAPAMEAVPGGNETILLVDDEDAVRRMAARTLTARGYRVVEATSAVEALADEPGWGPIDLVVTDVVMAGMGGRELAVELARRRPGVRLLYISGYTDDEATRRGLLDAGAPFLQKPFEAETLARRVRQVLDSQPR